ncbi:MAG: arginine--tRNA ligase [Bdellovibrionales bacterium]|jgi:arginyl-tRNA synthetase|nr:arginine--tRNA ligase [Bdellovibrionales bacterium]
MLRLLRHETAQYLANELRNLLPTEELGSDAATSFFAVEKLENALEKPKKIEHGHLALPVFPLAKQLRQPPPAIAAKFAQSLSEKLSSDAGQKLGLIRIEPVGGFLNFTFSDISLQTRLFGAIAEEGERLGYSKLGAGKRIVIDYSSPNVAKPMHVGTLRATVIGQAIRNIAETQGYEVIGLNHLGDWGVQFGKLAWAYRKWGHEYDFKNTAFQSLFDLYVRFHDEATKDPSLDAEGSLVFKQLEQGDKEIEKIWKMFVEITLVEDQKLWDLLGVKHDLVRGESFYNDRLKPVEDLLDKKGLLVESEGAMVVSFGDEMPPCLIRKSDGASLYATRDIASAIYRKEELKADLCLYVVGVDQTLHFKQVFKVLELAGFDWSKECHHISFGLYRFKDGVKMSTRKGNVIFLEDILRQAIERTGEIIAAKNPSLSDGDRKQIAQDVGVGAVIFNDLSFDRVKNVEFDWERILSFEGDSGPYVQYMHVRCASLLRKYKEAKGKTPRLKDVAVLSQPEERELVRLLLTYDEVLESAFATFKPNILAQYLLEVCAAFSRFYHGNRILGEAEDVESSRMALVFATKAVLQQGLKRLSVNAPEVM